MSKLRVGAFSISLDGFGAGPDQTPEEPLGVGGEALHDWFVPTRTFNRVAGREGGTTGIDDQFAARVTGNVGAWIMGRNMFGPVRGPWPDENWTGWWGDNPPYHCQVFVLTHHERAPVEMAGGTTFIFFTGGIEAALRQARAAANGKDVMLGGGTDTIRQYLSAGLIDELNLTISPMLLGSGEHLFGGIDAPSLGYRCTERVLSENAMHVTLTR
jgi:dihydrofolate reductase